MGGTFYSAVAWEAAEMLHGRNLLQHCCMGSGSAVVCNGCTLRSRLDLGSVLSASEAAMASESAQ